MYVFNIVILILLFILDHEPLPGPSQGNPAFQRAYSSSGARGKCPVNTKSRPSVTGIFILDI